MKLQLTEEQLETLVNQGIHPGAQIANIDCARRTIEFFYPEIDEWIHATYALVPLLPKMEALTHPNEKIRHAAKVLAQIEDSE